MFLGVVNTIADYKANFFQKKDYLFLHENY
jgi:hypothetical protein